MRLLAAAAAAALIVPASALGWTWPVAGPVLIGFSFDPAHPYAAGQHRGIDIGAPAGAPVGAPASGTVSFAGSVPGGGRIVTIQTARGAARPLCGALAQAAPGAPGRAPPARPRAPVRPTPHARGRSRVLPAVPRDRGRPRRARAPLATRAVPVQTRSHVETRSRADLRRRSSVRARTHVPTPARGRALPSTAGPARAVTPS